MGQFELSIYERLVTMGTITPPMRFTRLGKDDIDDHGYYLDAVLIRPNKLSVLWSDRKRRACIERFKMTFSWN